MVNPKLMSDDRLIQCFTVKATTLNRSNDEEQEFDALKRKILGRMGDPNNADNNTLLDELVEVTTQIVDIPVEESHDICDRYFEIKKQILIMVENSVASVLQN